MKQRNQTLRKKAFERDNFTCQKCGIQDNSANLLQAHHIIPLAMKGENKIDNLITLCSDCHHFAPNSKEEFIEYMKDECNGTMTIFLKALKKVREEHLKLFEDK